MVNPAIQNDFSYYRRTLNRMKLSKKDLNISIRDELANRMSLFFAYPTPMMNVINETTVKFLSQGEGVPREGAPGEGAPGEGIPREGVSRENVTNLLATMANICQEMVGKGR